MKDYQHKTKPVLRGVTLRLNSVLILEPKINVNKHVSLWTD
jgi:hypothetical protein